MFAYLSAPGAMLELPRSSGLMMKTNVMGRMFHDEGVV
jgi:hypothetical protein